MTVDHCGTGNTASPICSPEQHDLTAGVACWQVTWRCMDCGTVVDTEHRTRRLVADRGPMRYPDDELGYSTGHHPTYVRRLGDGGAVWRGL
jgi:hypothetical protein